MSKALTKRCAIRRGSSTWYCDDADASMAGEQTPPNPRLLSTRNWVSPYRCLLLGKPGRGRQTARNAVAGAGKGGRKKRRLVCNGRDRGLNVTPRETGLTCGWSFLSTCIDKNSSKASEGRCDLFRLPSGRRSVPPPSNAYSYAKREVSKMSDIVNAQTGDGCSVASDVGFGWSSIDWKRVEQNVRRLQIRIAKATREGKPREVKASQRFLAEGKPREVKASQRFLTRSFRPCFGRSKGDRKRRETNARCGW